MSSAGLTEEMIKAAPDLLVDMLGNMLITQVLDFFMICGKE